MSGSLRSRDFDVDFDDGTRYGYTVGLREQRVERFVEAGARAAHFEVGVARQRREPGCKLAHGSAVDEFDGIAERDPECDRNDRQQRASAQRAKAAADHGTHDEGPVQQVYCPSLSAFTVWIDRFG